jgi:hypothetical protein
MVAEIIAFENTGELLPFPAMVPQSGPVAGRQLTPLSLDMISTVHFKSDGYKSRIPLRPLFLLKSPSGFLDLNPRSKM